MTSPELSSNVINLWYHYEQVAMHFNELIIQYRLHLMGGLGTIGALSGYLIGGKVDDPQMRNWLRALVSTGLLMLLVAAASLDLFYYDQLLQGAVDALVEFESKHPPIDLSTLIEKKVTYRGMIPIYFTYGLIFISLFGFTVWSWRIFLKERPRVHQTS
jgi:hypothetical protein